MIGQAMSAKQQEHNLSQLSVAKLALLTEQVNAGKDSKSEVPDYLPFSQTWFDNAQETTVEVSAKTAAYLIRYINKTAPAFVKFAVEPILKELQYHSRK